MFSTNRRSLSRTLARQPGRKRSMNKTRWEHRGRKLLMEQFENRIVLDSTLHTIAAANIDVVQHDAGNNTTSVTVTAPYAFNDFQIRAGSNRGDYNIQIGDSAADDPATGIVISAVRENGRDNSPFGDTPPNTVKYATVAIEGNASGYFIPIFDSPGGAEFNTNLASAFFSYDKWYGGWGSNTTNGGELTLFAGHASLNLGTHLIDNGNATYTVDLRALGIDSRTDGVLLVNGGKNEDNYSLSKAIDEGGANDGTWLIYNHDNGANGASYERDGVAFVYVPLADKTVVSGKFMGDTSIAMQSRPYNVELTGTGTYRLTIPGYTPDDGVLIISAEGGVSSNADNIVTYEADGDGWLIQSRDIAGMGLQTMPAGEAVASFIFIPGPEDAGVTVNPASGLLTTEAGETASFTVVLNRQPSADVSISLQSSDLLEGAVDLAEVVFTQDNWYIPQLVTVTGVDDALLDGPKTYNIVTGGAVSADTDFSGLDVPDVTVTNIDDDQYGITISPLTGLQTTEAGGTTSFIVRLNKAPTGDVNIHLESSDFSEGVTSVTDLPFSVETWNVPQTVTITGQNDNVDDGDVAYAISASITSSDSGYDGLVVDDLAVVNIDDDTAGITVDPISGVVITEIGGTAQFSVVLTSEPSADVTISVTSSDEDEGVVSTPSLTFTAADWNTPQVVTVTGIDDLDGDGDIDFTIVLAMTDGGADYVSLDPDDVAVTNLDSEPQIVLGADEVGYGIGDPVFIIDSLGTVSDLDSLDYDGGNLTVTITNATADDRLAIRHQGVGAGEIGVAGSDVTYGGVVIGSFAGGTGLDPLVITLNANATLEATQALLRGVTYENVSETPVLAPRTVEFVIEDGDGGVSNIASKTIKFVTVRTTAYQEGVDYGYGVYTGALDVQLDQSFPDTVEPIGQDANGLLVDWPDAGSNNEDQVLLRYENLFGDEPGQIPYGATIVSATLTVNTNNQGDGARMYRMLLPWDSEGDTWNSFGSNSDGRNAQPGVQADGMEARTTFESQVGTAEGGGDTGVGATIIGVTDDIQAWANGETNHGWFMGGFESRTDGWAFSPSETADPAARPKLTVEWIPSDIQMVSFQKSDDFAGYQSVIDTNLLQNDPVNSHGFDVAMFVDASDPGASAENQVLLWFQNIIGSAADQIPVGSKIHSAQLVLASTVNNAQGDGGSFHVLKRAFSEDPFFGDTWDSFNGGVQADGIDAAVESNAQAGNSNLFPNVQGGFNSFDVTVDVQAWVSGQMPNYGWAFLPWTNGTDGWGFVSSDGTLESERPELRVFFTPPGVTVEPTSDLLTTESGGTAEFSVVLDTPPLADVTVTVTSDDPTEGSVDPVTLTFTADDWNIPQVVTVTGNDDAETDGPITYTVSTAAASSDVAYDGLTGDLVSIINADNDTAGISVVPISGLETTEDGGTAQFSVVLNKAPTADVTIPLSSSDTTEGLPSPTSLTFTPANWDVPQVVTVTGVNDFLIDGTISYTIMTGDPTSTDAAYNALTAGDVADVSVKNLDDDVAGVTVTPTSGLVTTENGGSDTFTVVLNTIPASDVTIEIVSTNPGEGVVNPSTVTFNSSNWNVPRTITVTGVDDGNVNDDNVLYTVRLTTSFFTMDTNYRSVNPDDVTVTNIDNDNVAGTVALPSGDARYVIGSSGVGIDGSAIVNDTDPTDYNTATLTVTLSANGTADDRLDIRSDGTGAGQVGVSGSDVTYEGVIVGSYTPGTSSTPLVVTFNAQSTPAIAQAVLRAVTFSNVSDDPDTTPRTVEVVVVDNGGLASNVATKTVRLGLIQVASFQNGLDSGYGAYSGTADTQLAHFNPDAPLTEGGDTNGLLVDFDYATATSQVLLRYDSLFGDGPGQIPIGSQVLSATLIVDTNNPGQGGTLHRMLTEWDDQTDTWNSFANGSAPRNTTGGVQADGVEARAEYESQAADASGAPVLAAGATFFGVTDDIQAWANGETNNGWVMVGWPDRTDGWAFSPSEADSIADRPRLYVEWIPSDVESVSFRDGEDGYTGTVDTRLLQSGASTDYSTGTVIWTDAANASNESQFLLRFEDIIGNGASQIPAGATIVAAVLDLATIGGDATGDGGTFHTMLQSWSDTDTWNTLGGGVQADGVEASAAFNMSAGDASLAPNVPYGFNSFDVTADLQAWVDGSLDNYGWAALPWASGTDGWGVSSSEATVLQQRPTLRVYFSAGPRVVIDPVANLNATEEGSTATVNVQLSSLPTADVTVTVNGGDELEVSVDGGTTFDASADLIFSVANGTTPQSIVVRAIDDADLEGAHTGTLSFTAASSDVDYDGEEISDVTVAIADNETLQVSQVVINDGAAQRSKVTKVSVSFNSDIQYQDGAFQVRNRETGEFVTVSVEVVGSMATLTFQQGASVEVNDASNSLVDGNYELIIDASKVTSVGGALDGNRDGTAGDSYTYGTTDIDKFFRYFGDSDGDRDVDSVDLLRFRTSFNKSGGDAGYLHYFDLLGDDDVDSVDLLKFRTKFNKSLEF